jgi:hypothetical protein
LLLPAGGASFEPEVIDGSSVDQLGPTAGFRVLTQDGFTFEYGTSPDSRVVACSPLPPDDCTLLDAALSRAVDPHGLAVVYRWFSPPGSNLLHLDRITFTHAVNGSWETGALVGPERAVVLHYDPVAPWRTLQAGIARTLARRVARIEVKVGTERIREYQIEYVNTRDSGFVLASIDVAGREGPLYPAPAPVEPLVSFGYRPDGWNWDSWSEGQPYCTARRPATTTPTGGTSCATTRPAM